MGKRKLPPEVLEFFKKQGAKGGKIGGSAGGKQAAANMTPKERTARAKKASDAAVASRQARKRQGGKQPDTPG